MRYPSSVIPPEEVQRLVDAHAKLDEPTSAAIWIKRDAPEAWLVEVIPDMADDDRADEPVYFSPGVGFRFPLALIVGNTRSLEKALRERPELAREVAAGTLLLDGDAGQALVDLARKLVQAA